MRGSPRQVARSEATCRSLRLPLYTAILATCTQRSNSHPDRDTAAVPGNTVMMLTPGQGHSCRTRERGNDAYSQAETQLPCQEARELCLLPGRDTAAVPGNSGGILNPRHGQSCLAREHGNDAYSQAWT